MGEILFFSRSRVGPDLEFPREWVKPVADVLTCKLNDGVTFAVCKVLLNENCEIVDFVKNDDPTVITGVVHFYIVVCVISPNFVWFW